MYENIDKWLFVCTSIRECLLHLYNSQHAENIIISWKLHLIDGNLSIFKLRITFLHDNFTK
jgi:hypothetical protein